MIGGDRIEGDSPELSSAGLSHLPGWAGRHYVDGQVGTRLGVEKEKVRTPCWGDGEIDIG